jgi:dolichyl-phosphate-mannose-protein mannosyltransferase
VSTRGRSLDAALALGLFALGLGMQLAIVDRGAFYMDEGFVLETAAEINRGKVMYRDIIIPAPGPATFYLLAALFRVTGNSFLASRGAIAVVSSALAAVLFLLVRGAVSRPVALLAGLAFLTVRLWAFPHWLFFHYATLAGFLVATAYLLVAWALERASLRLVALAGLVAGVGVLAKQDVGGAGLVGLAATIVLLGGVPRFMGLVALGVGALVAAVPTLAYFASQGALGSLFDQTVRWTFRAFAEFDYLRLPHLPPFLAQDPDLRSHIGEYAPSILVTLYWKAITASALFRQTAVWDVAIKATPEARRRRSRATLVVAYAAATLAAFNPPRDWLHLFVLYHPTLLVLALLLERVAGERGDRRGMVVGLAALAVGGALLLDVLLLRDLRRTFDTPVVTAAGTVWLPREEAGVVYDLLAYVATHTAPDDPLPVIPYHPLVQFLADRTAGTRNLIFWPVRSVEASDERLIAEIDAAHAPTLVYSISQYAHLHRFRVSFPELFAHLVERYEIARTFTPPSPWGLVFCALAPRAPEPPPLVDLAERLDEATVRAEDGSVLAGEPRAAVAGRTLWPFRHVVYQRPGRGGPTTIAIPVDLHLGARLRFGYGLNPDEWVTFTPAAVSFSVGASVDDEPLGTLFSATADPQRRPSERVWKEVEIDLRQLAGKHVVLEFHTATESPNGLTADLAGWAEPVILGDNPGSAPPP